MANETATLAAGCFWCIEAVFDGLAGVQSVESGYIGGHVANPTYNAVCGGKTGHAEAIRVVFDPAVVSFHEVLDIFFEIHDPSQLNRQGNDVGTQYRSAIFPHSPEQEAAARAAIVRAQADHPSRPIVTTIEPLSQWYVAENYHQEYFEREGNSNPYCQIVVAPKLAKFRKKHSERLKTAVFLD
ncbi:peptide-methionine (S)-S-oxide reductase MsrA [Sphingomonas sp.]|uniref:peptide-methionine (S)-S-oxide reductase MsrA n=1 Tax=Sphingomonas sp. TaxID=28214 RepID=UPI0025F85C88|nr:peptide-methionine (S)-S-oxide reductase MsrA [Sphingomonas sp.]